MNKNKISLGSWAFSFGPFEKDPWSFSDFLLYTANAGFDGVEINGFRPHPHPDDYDTPSKCRELMREITDLGLGVSGYAPDFHLVPPAEVNTTDYFREIRKCLSFCNRCGINVLRVDSVCAPVQMPHGEYEKKFSTLASTWSAAAEESMRAGVLLVWEFEPGLWLNKPSEILRMHEAVGHGNFKILFDTSHAYMVSVIGSRQTGDKEIMPGGLVEFTKSLEGRIGHLHLIDSDGTLHNEETSTHTPFGEGNINLLELLCSIRPTAEKLEWWCVDFCFCPTTERDAKAAVPFLRKTAKQLYQLDES